MYGVRTYICTYICICVCVYVCAHSELRQHVRHLPVWCTDNAVGL